MTIDLDEIYRKLPLQEIPWNVKEPPKVLVDLVEGGKVRPCKALDFGCGAGNYVVYLAGKGFDVTGIDISPTAIHLAQENAKKAGVRCRFIAADVLGDLKEVDGTFDFAYDWELLHHLFPEQRKIYAANVHRKLNPQARYLSLCFSEQDPAFEGSGKYRDTPLGTRLYFSSEEELRDLFKPYFEITELRTIQIQGKGAPHLAVYAFMKRR
jgi:cyclopropane fatty-acyl-phospholipid synthase-like methyltransferase